MSLYRDMTVNVIARNDDNFKIIDSTPSEPVVHVVEVDVPEPTPIQSQPVPQPVPIQSNTVGNWFAGTSWGNNG